MAFCEQGYPCQVCGEEVETIVESGLYLRFVLGEIDATELPNAPEHHIRCNPVLAQFIVHDDFDPVTADGPFDKRFLDPADVAQREDRVTRAWLRLHELAGSGLPLSEYPLEDSRVPSPE